MLREDDRVPLEMVLSDHKMCFEDGKWRMGQFPLSDSEDETVPSLLLSLLTVFS